MPEVRVPLMDLGWQIAQIRAQVDDALSECVDETAFVQGARVQAFEGKFAAFCATTHAVGCGSGTDALYLALAALGIGAGDEVIVPAMTFFATLEAVAMAGATPVIVDVDESSNIDPVAVQRALSARTRAIIPVHLYGHSADLTTLREIATPRGIRIVSDAAQAHGATHAGQPIGRSADITCFSFYPGKNLGAFGDAGASVTDDPEWARDMQMRRNHGRTSKYEHDFYGTNMRMDEIQAAVLSIKLAALEDWTNRRRAVARRYREGLDEVPGLGLPIAATYDESVWHLYVVECANRDALATHLRALGISTGIHYPIPLHLQPACAGLGLGPGAFPVAERKAHRVLSLPMFEGMEPAQTDAVIAAVRAFFE